jgi:two-component system, response regulator PdtaR
MSAGVLMNILLVEDEPMVALLLSDVLGHAGHTVQGPVASVAAGLAEAVLQTPDLALVDVELGRGGDGIDLARLLHVRWRIPVLFLSAHSARAWSASDVALGLVQKPYSPTLVLRCVDVAAEIMAGRRPESVPHDLDLF